MVRLQCLHTVCLCADLGAATVGHIREVCMHVHTYIRVFLHTFLLKCIHATYMHAYIIKHMKEVYICIQLYVYVCMNS